MIFPGFIGQSYTARSVNIDCQRCVNLYLENDESKQGAFGMPEALIGTPGLLLWKTVGDGPIRGEWTASNGTLYVVSGDTLYSVASDQTETSLGTLKTSSGQVSMCDDGYNLIIVDGQYGYDYNFQGATFSQITDDGFSAADQVILQDTYFIFNKTGTNQFFMADLPSGDATANITFDTGYVAAKEGFADPIIAILSVHENLWLIGSKTAEVWYDSGASDFPFEQISGAFLQQGCVAKFSVAQLSNTFFWLGSNENGQAIVYSANGFSPQRMSTHAVEYAISQYSNIEDAIAWTYQSNGHSFYALNFPSASTTWVFDVATMSWHERTYMNSGVVERHRANTHAFAYGLHLVGDYQNGNIYQLSDTQYTDNGAPIWRVRTAPHLMKDKKRISYKLFELEIESGVGLDGSEQGDDPQAILQWSDDGGHTWSNEHWQSMGKIGETKCRVLWRRLGQSRDRVFRVTISDPVKTILVAARFEAQLEAA